MIAHAPRRAARREKENSCQNALYLDKVDILYYNNPQGFTVPRRNALFTVFTVLVCVILSVPIWRPVYVTQYAVVRRGCTE